jgi:ketosteroid isomerase-like protein
MRASILLLPLALSACAPDVPPEVTNKLDVLLSVQTALDGSAAATRAQDIDAYMALMPADLVIHDQSGAVITREQQRANVLRDWSIIPQTLRLETRIDSLDVHGDTAATVYTFQQWERLMKQRTGATLDTVLTTQAHRERWRSTPDGWRGYEIEELGGTIHVNGEPWQP